jgi:tetratricopeptide (TPR) repeat protein
MNLTPSSDSSCSSPSPSLERLCTVAGVGTLVVCICTLVLRIAAQTDFFPVFDDAYIFHRFARNLLEGHGLAYNPSGPQVYGATSLLYLLVVTPLTYVAKSHVVLACLAGSILSGLAFMVFSWRLLWEKTQPKAQRWLVLALCTTMVVTSSTVQHFVTGMDTMFDLAVAAGFLLQALRVERAPRQGSAVVLGVIGGLIFFVRPELAVFGLAVPGALALERRNQQQRIAGRTALITALSVLGCGLATAWLVFGWPLPLPFRAKSLMIYGAEYKAIWTGEPTRLLLGFLRSYWPLVAIIGLDLGSLGRDYLRVTTKVEQGTLVATAIVLTYVWLSVLPIMGFFERFFQPLVPALLLLSGRALARLVDTVTVRSPRQGEAVALGAIALLWTTLFAGFAAAAQSFDKAHKDGKIGRFELTESCRSTHNHYWFALDEISQLPDDLTIAATEIGVLGSMNPGKVIIDMAGLTEPRFSTGPLVGQVLLGELRPDLVYMPYPHYAQMYRSLEGAPAYRDYEVYSASDLGTSQFGIAIRHTGRHAAELHHIVNRRLLLEASRQSSTQPEEARRLAQRVLLEPKDQAEAQFIIGSSYSSQGDHERAVGAYQRSLELNGRHARAANNLGNSLMKLRRYEEALAAFLAASRLEPASTLYRNNIAWVQRELLVTPALH